MASVRLGTRTLQWIKDQQKHVDERMETRKTLQRRRQRRNKRGKNPADEVSHVKAQTATPGGKQLSMGRQLLKAIRKMRGLPALIRREVRKLSACFRRPREDEQPQEYQDFMHLWRAYGQPNEMNVTNHNLSSFQSTKSTEMASIECRSDTSNTNAFDFQETTVENHWIPLDTSFVPSENPSIWSAEEDSMHLLRPHEEPKEDCATNYDFVNFQDTTWAEDEHTKSPDFEDGFGLQTLFMENDITSICLKEEHLRCPPKVLPFNISIPDNDGRPLGEILDDMVQENLDALSVTSSLSDSTITSVTELLDLCTDEFDDLSVLDYIEAENIQDLHEGIIENV